MGSLLLAGGEPGHRYSLKHASVMIHRKSTLPSHLQSQKSHAHPDMGVHDPQTQERDWRLEVVIVMEIELRAESGSGYGAGADPPTQNRAEEHRDKLPI